VVEAVVVLIVFHLDLVDLVVVELVEVHQH
jgi:hypothetical protein